MDGEVSSLLPRELSSWGVLSGAKLAYVRISEPININSRR